MATVAEQQIEQMVCAQKPRIETLVVGRSEYRGRVAVCMECSSAINTQSLCLECGCDFIRSAWFKKWKCKLGKF